MIELLEGKGERGRGGKKRAEEKGGRETRGKRKSRRTRKAGWEGSESHK